MSWRSFLSHFWPSPPAPPPSTWRDAAVAKGVVPVCSDWTYVYGIDRGGSPVFAERTDWADLRRLRHRRLRHVVLWQASREVPGLAHLAPVRKPEDNACESCGGSGVSSTVPGVVCWCGGSGWLPAGVPQAREAEYEEGLDWVERDSTPPE